MKVERGRTGDGEGVDNEFEDRRNSQKRSNVAGAKPNFTNADPARRWAKNKKESIVLVIVGVCLFVILRKVMKIVGGKYL